MTLQFPGQDSDCRQMEALLPPFVDGEARPAVRAAVEAHLATCAACRSAVAAQREVRALLVRRRAALVEPAPTALAAELRRVVAARPAAHPARTRWSALAAAAALVLAVTGGFAWATGHSSVLLAAQLTLDHIKCFVIDGDDHGQALTAAEGQSHFHQDFGMDVRLPVVAADGRASLVSVRQCLYGEGWIAHALYRVDGQAVSLFVMNDPHEAAAVDAFGRHAQVITRGATTYVLVAPNGVPQVAGALGLEAE
jgi:hypothetical protein